MSEDTDKSKHRSNQYDKVIDQLIKQLDATGVRSWDFLQEQIREAVATEQAAEDLTKDEASLLRAYIERDLGSMGYLMQETGATLAQWLNFDLDFLETEVVKRLMSLADHTRVDFELLRERLDHGEAQYMADEMTVAGTLSCLDCGAAQVLKDTAVIQPCASCGARLFERAVTTATN